MNISKIKNLMNVNKISQREIAKMIDMTQAGFNNALSKGDFKVSTLEKIAGVLGVPVAYFFDDENNNEVVNLSVYDEMLNSTMNNIENIINNIFELSLKILAYGIDVKRGYMLGVLDNMSNYWTIKDIAGWYGDKNINSIMDLADFEKKKYLKELKTIEKYLKANYKTIKQLVDNFILEREKRYTKKYNK